MVFFTQFSILRALVKKIKRISLFDQKIGSSQKRVPCLMNLAISNIESIDSVDSFERLKEN